MKRRGVNMNIGTSSLLLIFVVLSLVSFAVLSLSSAVTNRNLVTASGSNIEDYYKASNEAMSMIDDFDKKAVASYQSGSSLSGYDSFDIEINKNSSLHVTVSYHKPDDNGHVMSVTEWKVVTEAPEIDTRINVLH